MRPVLHGDLVAAGRALLAAHPLVRAELADAIIRRARAADRFRRRTGRRHPQWGTGTLESAARSLPLAPTRAFSEPGFAACLMLVVERLRRARTGPALQPPPAQPTQRVSAGSSRSRAGGISSPHSSQ